MTALDIIEKYYKSTKISAALTTGIIANANLDCNCIDCGEDADCSSTY